ncbi:MAG: hypothetical protein JST16_02915 [Bdellovibrionales bacterium]|nr:hypothetical protein [Bdellovibrionales bacterium]
MKNLPKLNASYWALMLICTTMGELIGNLLSRNFELGYTQGAILDICVFGAMIFGILFFKLKNDIFYWLLILMGNIGGTNLADWVTLEPLDNDKKWGLLKPLQLGTQLGSLAVLGSLLLVLVVRYLISRKRGEESLLSSVFYWLAILLSSTFGTTSGDFITNDTPLGAFGGSVFLLVLLAICYSAFRYRRLSGAMAYWSALVLMHPIGATIGNYVSKPIGLNLGNVYTNVALAVFFVVIYLNNARLIGTDARRFSH